MLEELGAIGAMGAIVAGIFAAAAYKLWQQSKEQAAKKV